MKRTILLYGLIGGALITALRLVEYRWLVLEHSLEVYGGIVAALFAVVGIWLGRKLTRTRETLVVREVPVRVEVPVEVPVPYEVRVPVPAGSPFERNEARLRELQITPRELEILEAVAAGLSNKEIADQLFVSENTVKTHAVRVFAKLGAKRRTQAVQLAKEAGIIA
ncbi:MAG: response regulator transcription factor [Candidatus Eisenbacteria bacterium]|uniref:Response regulator transcription factor n=1 Tax=Eiseniibacteriota bacterium TaxID=2212470 RepID=A0A933SD66_UNCEI|nr:response regulator transcription factor [Candidatus Eisenbacteria bacterium]